MLLIDAAGVMDPRGIVPPRRDPEWCAVKRTLLNLLDAHGARLSIRGPASLWILLHVRAPPREYTWDQFMGQHTLDTLVARASAACPSAAPRVASWNIRWLQSLTARRAPRKRAVVAKHLLADRLVCLQETHWDATHAELWRSRFPGQLYYACARPGPHSGLQGGTAILVPFTVRCHEHRVLVDGCANAVCIDGPEGGRAWIVSVYLPPDCQCDVTRSVLSALRGLEGPVWVAGDFNTCLAAPRDADEDATAQRWWDYFGEQRMMLVDNPSPTHAGKDEPSTIDFVAGPARDVACLSVQVSWHKQLSDHALMTLSAQHRGQAAICTPSTFKRLRPAAVMELRGVYARLHDAFAVPTLAGLALPACPATPARLDTDGDHRLPPDDVAALPPRPAADPVVCHTPSHPPAPNPALADTGQVVLQRAIHHWWRRARRGAFLDDPLEAELRGAACTGRSWRPSEALARWLADVCPAAASGDEAGVCSPGQAYGWLTVLRQLRRTAARTQLPRHVTGPGVAREDVPERVAVGRTLFQRRHRATPVHTIDGDAVPFGAASEHVMWESRQALWTAPVHRHPILARLLRWYMPGRALDDQEGVLPDVAHIAAVVMHMSGSMPGLDGIPYEAYHPGASFVSHLIAQTAFVPCGDHCTEVRALDRILGDPVELFVWIEKKAGGVTPDGRRGLGIPSSLVRLASAASAAVAGPQVEPRLSPSQAAKKGGSCGGNISQVARHLSQTPVSPSSPPPPQALPQDRHDLLQQILGRKLADAVVRTARTLADQLAPAARVRIAALLLDQAKAFERVGALFVQELVLAWRLPRWVTRIMLRAVTRRRIAMVFGSYIGPRRQVHRGFPMGLPSSPLKWNMSYDPIVVLFEVLSGAAAPSFVDDTGMLVGDFFLFTVAFLAYLVVGKAAGLYVELHRCQPVACRADSDLRSLLAAFPVDVAWAGHAQIVSGLPPPVLIALIRARNPRAVFEPCNARPCTCRVKSAMVMARAEASDEEWAALSPLGSRTVAPAAPYLGVVVRTPPSGAGALHPLATWQSPAKKMTQRIQTLAASGLTRATASHQWDSRVVSCVPYPAQTCPMPEPWACAVDRDARRLFRTHGWARLDALFMLRPVFHVKGAPRCHRAAAFTANTLGLLRDGGWGGPHEVAGAGAVWARTQRGVGFLRSAGWIFRDHTAVTVQKFQEWLEQTPAMRAQNLRRVRTHIYCMSWLARYAPRLASWCQQRSRQRRWASTDGSEWHSLAHCTTFAEAHHTLRFMLGGIRAPGSVRTTAERVLRPHACVACGSSDVRLVWTAPSQGDPGQSWCSSCMRLSDTTTAWAHHPDVRTGPDSFVAAAAAFRTSGVAGLLPPLPGWRPHSADALRSCPLCRRGHHSSEHVAVWCVPVAWAWHLVLQWRRRLDPGMRELSLWNALCAPGIEQPWAVRCIQQVVYACTAAADHPFASGPEAAHHIVRAVVARHPSPGRLGDETSDSEDEDPGSQFAGGAHHEAHGATTFTTCCAPHAHVPRMLRRTSMPWQRARGPRPSCQQAYDLQTTGPCPAGQTLLRLFGTDLPALWPTASESWVPPPRVARSAADGDVNAAWISSECTLCGACHLTLVATAPMVAGTPVVTAPSPLLATVAPETHQWELTFDGGVRKHPQTGEPHAGSGAILWERRDGDWKKVSVGVLALPYERRVPLAEAAGLRLGLHMLLAVPRRDRIIRVIGDNLAVVRHGAGTARLSAPTHALLLETALLDLQRQGWVVQWTAVRRRFNGGADELATEGVRWSWQRADHGLGTEAMRVTPSL